jgi:hemolysin activation/secretion protein
VSLYGLVAGQASASVLPPSEKFFLGGLRFDRGFYSGQVTGDNAVTIAPELRLTTKATVMPFGHPIDIGPQLYVFYDWGETWENQRTDAGHRLQSFGGGARVTVTPYTEFDVEGVGRITRQLASSTVTPFAKSAFSWRVLTRF